MRRLWVAYPSRFLRRVGASSRVSACLRCFSRPKFERFPNPQIKQTRRVPLVVKRDSARVCEYYIIDRIDDNILWCYAIYETVTSGFRSGICQARSSGKFHSTLTLRAWIKFSVPGAKKFSKELYQVVLICPHLLRTSPLR